MFLSWKILVFHSIFISFMLKSSTSAETAEMESRRNMNDNFIEIEKKFASFDKKIEQLESKRNDAFNFNEIIKNYSRLINNSNNDSEKKFEKIEAKFNKMDEIFQKMEQFFNKTEKLENNFNKMEFLVSHLLKVFNACDPNPCLHGGRCRIATTGSGYECDCSKFRSGSRCENFNCTKDNLCSRLNDTLYVVIEAKLTWAEAKGNCEGLNMTLAMPKDEERTQFFWNQLRTIYKDTYFYLWIGLKRDEGMSKGRWEWVDGSALGEYTGGNKDMKSTTGSWFGLLYVGGGGSRKWDWASAIRQFNYICEIRLFAN